MEQLWLDRTTSNLDAFTRNTECDRVAIVHAKALDILSQDRVEESTNNGPRLHAAVLHGKVSAEMRRLIGLVLIGSESVC